MFPFQSCCFGVDNRDLTSIAHSIRFSFFVSPLPLCRGAPLPDSTHNGGAMRFGHDGKLYLTVGDGGETNNGQDSSINLGKLLRLNDDGSSPDDNPFSSENGYEAYDCRDSEGRVPTDASDDAVCAEIFAIGLRNPFRMSLKPNEKNKTVLAISDVGGKVWEELDFAGTDFPGVNYGYETMEGPCLRHSAVDCPVNEAYKDPFYFYEHEEARGGCIAGNAFVPDDIGWPQQYTFLFIDFVFYAIFSLIEDPSQECRTCVPPVPRYRNETFHDSILAPGEGKNEARMLDMFFGPYQDGQALYVIKFSSYDTVLRIRYTGVFNDPPMVDFDFEQKYYDVGETVQFNGSHTNDTEGDALTFQWFFGDGETSDEVSPSHTYSEPGQYQVTLIVVDALDQEQEKSKTVLVGTPLTAIILSPALDVQFSVGQVLRLEGQAFYSNGTEVSESLLEWEVQKHHDKHFHPFLDSTMGNDIELYPAPDPEDLYASLNSYLQIFLRVTDENGLITEVDRVVQPMLVTVQVDSNPSGLTVIVDEEPLVTSQQVWSWQEHILYLNAEDQLPHVFLSWSDGVKDRERLVTLNQSDASFLANFCVTENGACSTGSSDCCSGSCCAGTCLATNSTCEIIDGSVDGSVIELPDNGNVSDPNATLDIPAETAPTNPAVPAPTDLALAAPSDPPIAPVAPPYNRPEEEDPTYLLTGDPSSSPSNLRPVSNANESTSESIPMGPGAKALISLAVLASVSLIALFVFLRARPSDIGDFQMKPSIDRTASNGDGSCDGGSGDDANSEIQGQTGPSNVVQDFQMKPSYNRAAGDGDRSCDGGSRDSTNLVLGTQQSHGKPNEVQNFEMNSPYGRTSFDNNDSWNGCSDDSTRSGIGPRPSYPPSLEMNPLYGRTAVDHDDSSGGGSDNGTNLVVSTQPSNGYNFEMNPNDRSTYDGDESYYGASADSTNLVDTGAIRDSMVAVPFSESTITQMS
jgi:PKD repeat protein